MLRAIFGEQPRKWDGPQLETVQAIEEFIRLMRDRGRDGTNETAKFRKYEIWSDGLLLSMDELEQSLYAAGRYFERVTSTSFEEMEPAERLDYYRHVYYDKNAYIRLFSLLDKLAILLNDRLGLQTERMKAHFSYFTVLRNLRNYSLHLALGLRLDELKTVHQSALNRLRKRRNMEIHHMNAELQDDLEQSLHALGEHPHLENIAENLNDLDEGWEMVYSTLKIAFEYLCHLERE